MMKVFENIKRLREELGLSQAELAMLTDYSPAAICRIEKGDFHVPYEKILLFSKVFGVQPSDLMGWSENDSSDQLSPDEKAMINRYRRLNSTGRTTALSRLDELIKIADYVKSTDPC